MNRQLEMMVAEKASQVTYTGSGISIAAWIAQADWAMWTGIIIGVTGLLVNWYYKRREDARENAIAELKMERLRRGEDVD